MVEVLKVFDYIQIFFDGDEVLNVYDSYTISGRDSRDDAINELLRSLVGKAVDQAQLLPKKLTLVFSAGKTLSVEGDDRGDSYELISLSPAFIKSPNKGFWPSMELTDTFNTSAAILKRLETATENTVRTLGFGSRQHCAGDVTNGVSYYEWCWILSKDTTHGSEIFRRTLTVSFKQNALSSSDTPVDVEWRSEIFQQAQLSWYSWSGQISKPFSEVEREGFEELLKEASGQAEAALQNKKELAKN